MQRFHFKESCVGSSTEGNHVSGVQSLQRRGGGMRTSDMEGRDPILLLGEEDMIDGVV